MRALLISAALVGLGGCGTTYNIPPGKSEASFAQDQNACAAEAFRVHPNRTYSNQEDPQGFRGLADQINRGNYERRCMQGRGYTPS